MTIDWHNQHPSSWNIPQETSNTNGYLAPAQFQIVPITDQNEGETWQNLSKLAAEIIDDPLALAQLTDRVYTLLQQDLNRQRDRLGLH